MNTRSRADGRHRLEVALRYAAHGWPVLPLHTPGGDARCSCTAAGCGSPGKHPRTAHGLHDATTDLDRIRHWWQQWQHANLGVATGAASGLLVLDIDLPEGPATLARLQTEHGRLPATCEQRTGSGGRQLLFAHPGQPVVNRTGVQPGIDVRGDGGYIVVPPSTHASGARYRWTGRVPPAPPPGWLLELLDRTRTPDIAAVEVPAVALPAGSREQRYAASALHRELAGVASAVEGSRNDSLNRAAFNLGQLAAAGLLDPDQVAVELERVATGVGLGPVEARRTIASGLAAGLQRPRTAPGPTPPQGRSAHTPARRIGARHR
jgi:hypothetical protein